MELLFTMVGGSHSYGLNTPASDVDNRGVFLNEKLSEILGLQKHDDQQNISNGADDKYKELRRFLNLLKGGNTEALEMLFTTQYTSSTPLFDKLRNARQGLVDSARLYASLRGYMQGELRRANGELKGKSGKRKDMLVQYGFSPKNFVQLFRLAWAGAVFFQTGEFPVNVREVNKSLADTLVDLKTYPEKWNREELNNLAKVYEQDLDKAYSERPRDYFFDEAYANVIVLEAYYPKLEKMHKVYF